MKIPHKYLLYHNKWLQPYIRRLLEIMTVITYLASLLFIGALVYEHGFIISNAELDKLNTLYRSVWIIFLIDITFFLNIKIQRRNITN